MDNKVKSKEEAQQNLKLIISHRDKTKQEVQLFYAKNKMKFPPIMQSRQLILQMPQTKQNKSVSLNKLSIQSTDEPIANHQAYTNRNPNICRIQFKKQKQKRRALANDSGKGNIIQTISHSPRRYYLSQDKKKDLQFLNSSNNGKNTTLQRFIQQLNIAKQSKKNNSFVSKSLQYKPNLNAPSSVKPLLITRMVNNTPSYDLNPNQTLKDPNSHKEQIPQVGQRQERVAFLKKADKFLFLKKRQVKKEGLFEPWQQQSFPEQQYWMQNRK